MTPESLSEYDMVYFVLKELVCLEECRRGEVRVEEGGWVELKSSTL